MKYFIKDVRTNETISEVPAKTYLEGEWITRFDRQSSQQITPHAWSVVRVADEQDHIDVLCREVVRPLSTEILVVAI
jgi:hypothetical protein